MLTPTERFRRTITKLLRDHRVQRQVILRDGRDGLRQLGQLLDRLAATPDDDMVTVNAIADELRRRI
jgi:hypothetical protein